MSQVFSGDAVQNTASTNIPTTTETPVVMGNFLNPPFGNAKAMVFASVFFAAGTAATAATLKIRRNPNGENLVLMNIAGAGVTPGNAALFNVQCADSIPDGRPVQYELTVQQTAATGNATAFFASIAAILISG